MCSWDTTAEHVDALTAALADAAREPVAVARA
jgi:hypothetical protein